MKRIRCLVSLLLSCSCMAATVMAGSHDPTVTMSDGAQKCDKCESKSLSTMTRVEDRFNFYECVEPGTRCNYWIEETAHEGHCKTVNVTVNFQRKTVKGTDCACVLRDASQSASVDVPMP